MRKLLVGLALVGVLTAPMVAHADTFAFTVSGSAGGFSGTGTLTATNMGSYYQITDISGTGVTGLIAPGGFNGNDNKLFPNGNPLFPTGGSLVDSEGFSFNATMGDTSFQVNLFSNMPVTSSFLSASSFKAAATIPSAYSIYLKDSDGVTQTLPVTFSVTPTVPEPSSLILLGTGVLALAGTARRRFTRA